MLKKTIINAVWNKHTNGMRLELSDDRMVISRHFDRSSNTFKAEAGHISEFNWDVGNIESFAILEVSNLQAEAQEGKDSNLSGLNLNTPRKLRIPGSISRINNPLSLSCCSVCGGTGKPISGNPCICKGIGTLEAEAEGLRELVYDLQGKIDSILDKVNSNEVPSNKY